MEKICGYKECDRELSRGGLCDLHYMRKWNGRDMDAPVQVSGWGKSNHERLWSRVDIRGEDECWEWTASRSTNGYGMFKMYPPEAPKPTSTNASRAAYILHHGEEPKEHVLHHCDNPLCCNPNHLYIGTHTDNMRDKKRRGRAPGLKGDNNGNSKLKAEDVREIRRFYETGDYSKAELARMFGVTSTTVSHIITRRTWAHVD